MPGIAVNINNTTVNVNLADLEQKSGMLYMKDGVIRESRFSLGRAFLACFSPTLRAQQQDAAKAIKLALSAKYDFQFADFGKPVKGRQLSAFEQRAQAANKARCDKAVQECTAKYGAFSDAYARTLLSSRDYQEGTVSQASLNGLMSSAKQAVATLGARARDTGMSNQELLENLRRFPGLAKLFDAPNTVGGTIGEHTLDVMRQFDSQKAHYDLPGITRQLAGIPGFENFDAERFMKVVIAFHDIGKSIGGSMAQHENTIPILKNTMKEMGFNEQQIRLAANLVNNDLLGEWQTGARHNISEIRGQLRALAQDSGIPMKAYMSLQKLFYISDASSYPHIQQLFMRADENGKLHFKAPDGTSSPSKLDELLTDINETSRTEIAQLIHQELLAEGGFLAEGRYPIDLFSQDLSGKAYNIYDIADGILAVQEQLRAEIQSIPDEFAEVRELKLARLEQAVEMATMAADMKADHWSAAHTQGIIRARLEIRNAGISSQLPKDIGFTGLDATLVTGEFPGVMELRRPGGVSDRFFELVDAKGGSSKLLNATGQIQVASSWSGPSMAVKGYLEKKRYVDSDEHFYHATKDQHGEFSRKVADQYDKFAHAPAEYWDALTEAINVPESVYIATMGTAYDRTAADQIQNPTSDTTMFDTSIQYQMAMQMELLSNMSFPGNDPANHQVVIYRTDSEIMMELNGLSSNVRTATIQRGAAESGSFIYPIAIGGNVLTGQVVPYHRVVNSFMLSAQHSGANVKEPSRGAIGTNGFREAVFMSDGLQSTLISTAYGARLPEQYIGTIPLLPLS